MDYFFVSITGFALGVAARSLVPFGTYALAFILLIAGASALFYFMRRDRLFAVAGIFLLLATCGAGRTMLAPDALPDAFAPTVGANAEYEGIVVADPDIRETNQHVAIEIERDGERTRILAFAPLYPEVAYGQTVRVSGELEKPEPFATDGGRTFRYDRYLAKDGIFAIVSPAKIEVIAPPSGIIARFMGGLYGIKHALARGLEAALPEPSAGLAEGLLTGGKQGLGTALLDAFVVAGLVQIVVLSGYNVMIVADAVMKSLRFLPRTAAAAAAGGSIALFVIATGAGSSVLRAGVMACLALYARESGRTYHALRGFAAALFLMLLWNPFYLAYDPGFELSCAATLGIIIGTPRIEPYIARFVSSGFWREGISGTLAAQAFVLPLLLYQTGNLSLVSLAANLLVLPAVPIAMAASLAAGVGGMLAPAVAPAFGAPAYVLLSYIIAVGKYAAMLPLARLIIPAFPWWLLIGAYAALGWCVRKLGARAAVMPPPSGNALPLPPN